MAPPLSTNQGVLSASGLIVPVDGTAGYQTGCIFQHTDGGDGTSLYVNEGTYLSCDFDAVSTPEGGAVSLSGLSDVGTIGHTLGDILVADGSKYQEVAPSSLTLLSATPGTMTASKAVIPNAQSNIGAVKATSLAIGTSGAEVAITATPAQINSLASANAIISAGLGSTTSFVKGTAQTPTLIAANATKDRGVLVVVSIDTTFANGDGAQPTLTVGDDSNATKAFASSKFTGATAGSVYVIGFANTSTNKIVAAWTAGTGTTETGGATVTVIALPNS
jgi:hypothetical protein